MCKYGKSEQNWASYYYLLVVKLVVKWNGLLLRIFIYKKGARLGHALFNRSAEKLRIPQTHYIICIFFTKISKKKKSYAILFLYVRRIATHFLLHGNNISFLSSCQVSTNNLESKLILSIYFTII